MVSVVVPVFNQEKWIGRCIRSLVGQSVDRKLYDIIVVDDDSSDSTVLCLKGYENDITYIDNEVNMGLPASLNVGIRAAKSNYIVRVDSDDYVNQHFLSFMLEFIETNKYMDAIACDYYIVDDHENVITRKNCMKDPIGCGIIFRTEHLIDIGLYDEEFYVHEERDLRIRYEKQYTIHHLELPLYRYRRHKDNITNDQAAMKYHEQKLIEKHGK
jgi:glycosyltransferase involved in cell wall biosynthesis